MSDNFDDPIETKHEHGALEPHAGTGRHTGMIAALTVGLVLSLAGNGYLWSRSSQTDEQLTNLRDSTQAQISKLGDATTSLLEQRLQSVNEQLSSAVHDTQNSMNAAIKKTRSQAQSQSEELRGKLEEQQQQVATQLTQLKDATTSADSKINEVSTDVNGVKSDVTDVRTDVNGVKADVASTQAGLEKTSTDLKRAMGDMGVMSGLIATNGKELDSLRTLGERNYIEFNLSKSQADHKLGNISVTLKKTDPKRNRYTVEIFADDKRVEKKDRTVNEPVQFYVSGNRQPYEIVVNQMKKDQIVGYLAIPKVTLARQ